MTAALVWGDDQFWGFTAAAVCEGFLLHRAAKPKALCPVATPGCAGLPPGRRIHHLNMQGHMVIAQILQWLRLSFC